MKEYPYKELSKFTFHHSRYSENYALRNTKINAALQAMNPPLRRGHATSRENNCLLDSIFQQIMTFLHQNRPELVGKLGSLIFFIQNIRNRIGKTQDEKLSINHEVQGVQIITAIQSYLLSKLNYAFDLNLEVLIADNDGSLGGVDMTSFNNHLNTGQTIIPLKLLYSNYIHYEPLFSSDLLVDLTDAFKNMKVNYLEIDAEDLIKEINTLIKLSQSLNY